MHRMLFLIQRWWMVFGIAVLPVSNAWTQVVPAQRMFLHAWRHAGNRAFTPPQSRFVNVMDIGAVGDGETNDQPAVAAAIASLDGQPGVIFFPAGTYRLRAAISVPSGVVLRGQSARDTLLRFDIVHYAIRIYGQETGAWIDVVEAGVMHADGLRVRDTSGLSVGDDIVIRQDDDPAWNMTDRWAEKSAGQVARIVAITGDRIRLECPLRHDYPLTRSPEIRRIRSNRYSGVENLKVERLLAGDARARDNQYTIHFAYATDGWVRGVHAADAFGSHIALDNSSRIEISGCYLDNAHEHDGGGSGYGVKVQFRSGECLVQNNVFRWLRHSILLQAGANGNVFGYNYSRDTKSDSHASWAGDISLHGNYPYANLFEGNIVEHLWIDNSHNGRNGPFNTFFRNRAENCGFNMTDPDAHSQTIVGNELMRGGVVARLAVGNGYRLQGSNHFAYGNRSVAEGLQPPETLVLPDRSYYLTDSPSDVPDMPAWWTIPDALPPIGPEYDLDTEKINPARARYLAGSELTVPAPVPEMALGVDRLQFNVAATTRAIPVINAGEGTLVWRLDAVSYHQGADWIVEAIPAAGVVVDSPETMTVTIDRHGLGPGIYTATMTLTSNGGNIQLPVRLEVPAEVPIATGVQSGFPGRALTPVWARGRHVYVLFSSKWPSLQPVFRASPDVGPEA